MICGSDSLSEQPQLMVDPADLPCLMDLVLGAEMSDEERGGGIMESQILSAAVR